MQTRHLIHAACVIAVPVALALTGCGSSTTRSGAAGASVTTGANRSTKGTSSGAKATTTAVNPAPLAGGTVNISRISAAAERTLAARSLREKADLEVEVNGSTSNLSLTGAVDATGAGTATATSAAGTVTAVFRGGTAWVSATVPGFAQALPAGKSWIEGSGHELGFGAESIDSTLAVLNLFRGITKFGPAPAGTAEFRFSLPLALRRTPPSQRAALQRAFNLTGGGFLENGEMTIGTDGAVRTATFEADNFSAQATISLIDKLVIGGINAPVIATPPPPGEVVPAGSVPGAVTALARDLKSAGSA